MHVFFAVHKQLLFRPRIRYLAAVDSRNAMGRPRWTKQVEEEVYRQGEAKCHHCHCDLPREPRNGWHIDHFPVAYRDIEDQVCCGVTDARDVRNLVLSCPQCNVSHKHEEARCCGYTQCPCKRQWLLTTGTIATSALVGFAAGVVTGVNM
jgi:hypothetical protein